MNEEDMFIANRDGWNQRTTVHKTSEFYDIAGFKNGNLTLNPAELNAMGDVKGKSLLHLQCHFGLDTLSWARLGAHVTGIDFSDNAIQLAQSLSADVNVPAQFICCNIYDLPAHLHQQFDMVFTSYGVIGWLPDLDKWAAIISKFLKPGGTFYIAEFHPVVWMMDENFERIKYYYHNSEVIALESSGTYTDRSADIQYMEYSWNHSLAEVMSALISKGLTIQSFEEYSYSYYNCFNNTIKGADGFYRIKGVEDKLPMMFSIKALKH